VSLLATIVLHKQLYEGHTAAVCTWLTCLCGKDETMPGSMLRNFWVLATSLVLLASQIPALHGQESEVQVPPLTIRVTTHLVVIDVVVTDKAGKAVIDLKPQDFRVEENGRAQKIAVFSSPREPSLEGTRVQLAGPLPPGIYSNRPEYRMPSGPITVMLLDAANTPFNDQSYARTQMLKYVKEHSRSDLRMAIFTLTDSLQVLQDFTSDPRVLMAALERQRPEEQKMSGRAIPEFSENYIYPGPAGSLIAAIQRVQQFETPQAAFADDHRIEITLDAMNNMARILGGIPGRKNLIWLTGAFPFALVPENRDISDEELEETLPSLNTRRAVEHASGDIAATVRQSHTEEIREAAAQLASAQVAIYPVDVRGLVSGMEASMDDLPSRQPVSLTDMADAHVSGVTDTQETMREIALETGGRAFVNQNEIKRSVELAVGDAGASYTLGYYPQDRRWNGKYRTIKVKVRRQRVDARYRRGYFAFDPAQMKDRDSDRQLAATLAMTTPATPATLVAFSARVNSPAEDNGRLAVDFLVDANTLSMQDANGGKKFDVNFYAAFFSATGKMLSNTSMHADEVLNADDYKQMMQRGMQLHMKLPFQKDAAGLRLAVRDNRTGFMGSIDALLRK
jgi:VWFA-related protein